MVSEGDAQPNVQIELSAPAATTVTALYGHQAGTAESPSDFYVADGAMIWQPGQFGPHPVDVFITDDQDVEPDEEITIFVISVEGAGQASPSVATIRIIDNDSGLPDAEFFNPGTPNDPTVFVAGMGYSFEVGIRLSRVPASPLQVQWQGGRSRSCPTGWHRPQILIFKRESSLRTRRPGRHGRRPAQSACSSISRICSGSVNARADASIPRAWGTRRR